MAECSGLIYVLCISQLTKDIKGIKVGLVKEGFVGKDPEVDSMVRDAAQKLTEAGAIVEEVSIPMHKDGKLLTD